MSRTHMPRGQHNVAGQMPVETNIFAV